MLHVAYNIMFVRLTKLLKVPACVEIALLSPVQLLQFKIDDESASEET